MDSVVYDVPKGIPTTAANSGSANASPPPWSKTRLRPVAAGTAGGAAAAAAPKKKNSLTTSPGGNNNVKLDRSLVKKFQQTPAWTKMKSGFKKLSCLHSTLRKAFDKNACFFQLPLERQSLSVFCQVLFSNLRSRRHSDTFFSSFCRRFQLRLGSRGLERLTLSKDHG